MKRLLYYGVLAALLLSGCTNDHFITDNTYRKKVETQFEKQKELAKNRSKQLFGVFNQYLTTRETEALKFIYAYSSLSDLADYDGDFFLKNIRSSFAARDSFSWGKTVPENIFRHFVLPMRVNNENMDSSRWVFFAELKDRLKKLPMKEAVLEVNHWCHEKVTYRGSDGRTSSPLASVKTAWGRCGEESTFTVAALRSVGIPARQCYTPRWAHSDDNHAWVEVWVDGKWHFIGACEPDVDLDVAWFTKPARRAMLVNTTVFGDYEGPEDVLQKDPLYTRINVLANYAPVKKIHARVVDRSGKPSDSACVEFQLYNYAEFYPMFRTFTDKHGTCSFTTGYGDLLVWAAKNGNFGYKNIDVRRQDTVIIHLSDFPGPSPEVSIDLVPPVETEITATVSDSAKKANSDRLAFEDGLRQSYENTFIDSSKTVRFAKLVDLNPDSLWYYFHKCYGNWRELTSFVTQASAENRRLIFPLFENLSEKDLRDIDTAVLLDNINHAEKYRPGTTARNEFNKYILSPRVDNEFLKPFRALFLAVFDTGFINASRKNPQEIAGWLRKNITPDNSANYSRAPLTPIGVYELRVADGHSIDICFVAVCRTFGIPARLDAATKVPQYQDGGTWKDVYLFEKKQNEGKKGTVVLLNPPSNDKKPEYTTHYTIEQYHDGFFRTLDYEGSPLVQNYPCTLEIPAGPCLMVTGTRITDGTVMAKLTFFEVKAGETSTQKIELRKNQLPPSESGTVNSELCGKLPPEDLVVAWIEPDKEPTKHFLADLRLKKNDFGKWKGKFLIVLQTEEQMKSFTRIEAQSLPQNITYTYLSAFPVKPTDIKIKSRGMKNLPVVIFLDKKRVIHFLTEGYRIGTGDELLRFMK